MKKGLLFFFLLLSLGGYCQCTLTVQISATSPAICSGSSTVLTATATGGTAPYTYTWNTGETTPSITVNKATTYTVTVSDKTPGCQPVKQTITITASVTPDAPTAKGAIVCQNTSAILNATAPGGTYQWYDAATGGNFLGSGASFTTPPISTTTVFYVQTTIAGCTSPRTPVTVTLISRPVVTGDVVCQGNQATLTAANGDSFTWYDAPNGNILAAGATFLTPPLQNTTTFYVVGTINGCNSVATPVVATVTPPPTQPTASGATICSGAIATLHATAANGIFDWFTTPTGGTSLISSPDYTTPPLTATTTYYVQTSLNGCESPRTPVTVVVNSIPPPPTIPGVNTCYGTSATITVTNPTGTYSWFDASAGGNLLATGNTFNTPAIFSNATFYVSVNVGGCSSTRAPVNVTVLPQVPVPTVTAPLVCPGTSTVLTATGPGGTYQWYDAATAGNLLATGPNYTTPVLTTSTTYYIQTTIGGCTSARTPVAVTILPPATPPTAANASVCSGDVATLTATGGPGNYLWYDAPTGGNQLSAGQSFVTPPLTTTTIFYVSGTTANGCESTRTAVTVTVNPIPAAPTGTGQSVCAGSTATLTASASGGTFQWYDAATGGTLLASGSSFTTPVLFATTTYYVQNTQSSCPSSRTAVIATVTPLTTQFRYPSGTICTSGGNVTPTRNNPAGGTFSASPAGLVFISTTTGQINVAASTPGDYIISYAGNGPCPHTTTARVSIVTTPNAQFTYSGPFCQTGVNPLPVFPAGASAGVFTATPAGLAFISTSTGEIDLSASSPGTYTVTNTIAASGGCPASVMSSTVTIDQTVAVSAGPNQTVQSGATVQLAGSITGGITTGKWSGGAGTFSNPNLLNAVYTPAAGETSVTLTLTSDDPPGPCGIKSDKVTITINPIPAAPTAAGQSICPGSTAILSATAPGGLYKWFDAATGGTQLGTGPNFTTPPLTVNTTYYVQTTVGGFTSNRTPVTVTINAVPAAPSALPQSACNGSPTTLTATGSAGTYAWYDAPVGGNLLSTSNTYLTPPLTAPASYYVEAIVNGCISPRTKVDVTVNPAPTVTSSSLGSVCSGNALNYAITADLPGSTFTWSRAAVANISNPAVTGQTASTITESLINTGTTPVNVTYIIIPVSGTCPGTPFNYVVTVFPPPVVTSATAATICSATSTDYSITFSSPVTALSWSRAAVPGISNLPVTGQAATTVREVLFNTTNVPVDVTYVFKYSTPNCTGLLFNFVVTVNPSASITSAATGTACSGTAQGYVLTSDIPTATFTWSRVTVPGISNPAVTGQTSGTIDEALINNTTHAIKVLYTINALANGCPGPAFTYSVTVNPQPATPVANANSPVCINSTIQLKTPSVPNATYLWTGPNGFTSPLQNPNITNVTLANSGVYNLFVIVNGCSSDASPVTVVVDALPIANAGGTQAVCHNVTSVQLNGSVTGGTTTGIWTTAGTGTFSPAPNQLDAQYIPSAADVAAGSVKLTLSSTSKDDCNFSVDDMTIIFQSAKVTSASAGTACNGVAQNYQITSNTPSTTFTYSRAAVAGISNAAVTDVAAAPGDLIDETLINNGTTSINVIYVITPISNGCPGTPFNYTVTVNPTPVLPVATSNSPVCVNTIIKLSTPAVAGATYAWTGPGGFSSASQNPTINNVTAANAGVYNLTETVNGCTSPVASVTVAVDALPVAVAGGTQTLCHTVTSVQLNGTISGGTTTGVWSTAGTGTFSPAATQLDAQYIPSAADIAAGSVKLTLSSTSNDNCNIATSDELIIFQSPKITSAAFGTICNGVAQNYQIASNTPSVTFTYSRNAVAGVSNPAVSNVASGVINETLFNTTTSVVDVTYTITALLNGCPGTPFTYTVEVDPTPVTPAITANSPLCVASTLHLTTATVANATYAWTGPNGFSSASQNPTLTNVTAANAGSYNLTVTVNGCTSNAGSTTVVIDNPPKSNAGPDQNVCTTTGSVQLAGTETGGTPTGVWSTSGSGTFSPSTTDLNATYTPSAADKAGNGVVLTLTSTSNDDCTISTSTMNLTFRPAPAVDAGPDQEVCSQDVSVQLAGKILIAGGGLWSTSGTGAFSPAATQQDAVYLPSAQDISKGSVTLTLLATGAGPCNISTDQMVIKFIPPPTVNAGGTVFVLHGKTIILNPTVSDNNVTYLWTPNVDIDNNTAKNPVITGDVDMTYTLTVTDSRGCVSTDQVMVKVSPEVVIPNTFTPNNDGINDIWNIQGLIAYTKATVDVFDRYGQKVFHSVGYPQAWDGTYGGKFLPTGTYYYIIDTKFNNQVLSGAVTIVR